jgi:replication factor C small subunit
VANLIGKALLGDYFDFNFIEHNASNERGVDTVREIIKSSLHQSMFTPIKIIFLDESDGLTPAAQNMLRKPLEDRKSMRYILSANNDTFIKAIRSRCVVFDFKPISADAIRQRLEYIAEREGLHMDGEIEGIAKASGGDMRLAINELQRHSYRGDTGAENEALMAAVRNMDTEAV